MYRILSFNLLCAGKGHRIWQNRVPLVCSIINGIYYKHADLSKSRLVSDSK